jgi:hypothetical protein
LSDGSSQDLLLQIQLSRIPSAAKHSNTLNQCRPKQKHHRMHAPRRSFSRSDVGALTPPPCPARFACGERRCLRRAAPVAPSMQFQAHRHCHQRPLAETRYPFSLVLPLPTHTCCLHLPMQRSTSCFQCSPRHPLCCCHQHLLARTPTPFDPSSPSPPPWDTCSTHLSVQNSTSCSHSSPRNHRAAASV